MISQRAILALAIATLLILELPSHRVYIYYTGGLRGHLVGDPSDLTATQVWRVLRRLRDHLTRYHRAFLLVDDGDSVFGPDPVSGLSHGAAVASLWRNLPINVVGLGPDDRRHFATRLSRLRALGLTVAAERPADRIPVYRVGGLRIAFVGCGERARVATRIARAHQRANVVVLLASVSRLERLNGCGADAVILTRYADGASPLRITHLPDGTPVAPFVDGRHTLGCLQIETRGLLRQRLVHGQIVADLARNSRARGRLGAGRSPAARFWRSWPGDTPAVLNELIGYGCPGLTHDFVYFRESAMGDYVTDVMRTATGAQVALLNHLAIRTSLEGAVGQGDVARALPFHDEIALVDMRGTVLRAILRRNTYEDRSFLQFSGLTVSYVPDHPDSVRAEVDGAPLDDARSYRVATIDYLLQAPRYAGLFRTRPLYTGLMLTRVVRDDIWRRRIADVPPRRSAVRGVTLSPPPSDREPDLAALKRWDLAKARAVLRKAVREQRSDLAADLLWLGFVDYFEDDGAGARRAWKRAEAFPSTRARARALAALAIRRRPALRDHSAPSTQDRTVQKGSPPAAAP